MLKAIIGFLVLLNPVALYVYLQPVSRELETWTFMKVLIKASLISLAIFIFFAWSGEYIFAEIIQIRFEAFRIFGGVVFFIIAIMYLVNSRKAIIELKEDLHDTASEIALPFMVGAGTISYSVIIGHKFMPLKASFMLFVIMAITVACIYGLHSLRRILSPTLQIAFDKIMAISLRLIGFFVGAIGVDMIITGIDNHYFS
ncbi:MAG: MarC family protein [Nitrospirota bacterium]